MEKYKLFVGIDISKDWIDVALISEKTSICQRFDNCKKGYRSMLSWLKPLRTKIKCSYAWNTRVCMAHYCGITWLNTRLALWLKMLFTSNTQWGSGVRKPTKQTPR